jgi:hypothetical protein
MRIDVESCRTHVLPVALPKAAPATVAALATPGISVNNARPLCPPILDGYKASLS